MIARILRCWRLERRWRYGDRLGWSLVGEALHGRTPFRRAWALRNSNRLYRLLRGTGNPWGGRR